jgi:hypothetical protein
MVRLRSANFSQTVALRQVDDAAQKCARLVDAGRWLRCDLRRLFVQRSARVIPLSTKAVDKFVDCRWTVERVSLAARAKSGAINF